MKNCIILVAAILTVGSAVDIRELVKNPRAHNQQVIAVTGVARVEGLTFELYANASDAKNRADAKEAIFISTDVAGPRYDQYDNRWVKIEGKVDADEHGSWGYACTVFLNRLEALPVMPAGKHSRVISGVFRNEDETAVEVFLYDEAGKEYAEFSVPSRETNGTGIRKGEAKIRTAAGKVMSEHSILTSPSHSPYRDDRGDTFYYRIRGGTAYDVPPSEGAQWETHNAAASSGKAKRCQSVHMGN